MVGFSLGFVDGLFEGTKVNDVDSSQEGTVFGI